MKRFNSEVERRVWPEFELVILIQIGANDLQEEDGELRVRPQEFEENLERIIDEALGMTENVILLGDGYTEIEGPLPWDLEKKVSDKRAEKYHKIRKKLSNDFDIPYISIRENWSKEEWFELMEDGVHPNNKGHKQIYLEVKQKLENEGLI